MTAPLSPEREQYWREMARTGAAGPSIPHPPACPPRAATSHQE